jgi:hypothetical protein
MKESTATKLRNNEALGTNVYERWYQARESSERKRDSKDPRSRVDDREEDTDKVEAREDSRSRKNLELSS